MNVQKAAITGRGSVAAGAAAATCPWGRNRPSPPARQNHHNVYAARRTDPPYWSTWYTWTVLDPTWNSDAVNGPAASTPDPSEWVKASSTMWVMAPTHA